MPSGFSRGLPDWRIVRTNRSSLQIVVIVSESVYEELSIHASTATVCRSGPGWDNAGNARRWSRILHRRSCRERRQATIEGVQPGDKLVRVDGLGLAEATRGAVFSALHGKPGTVRLLTLERDGKEI